MITIESEIPNQEITFLLTWSPVLNKIKNPNHIIDEVRTFANNFRRILISQIPTLAIDTIEVDEDVSQFGDLNVLSRLELLPIPCTLENFILALDVKGPLRVSSKHLGLEDDITLCYLRVGEKLKLTCTANYGKAETHAKWSPVTMVGLEYVSFNSYRFRVGLTGCLSGRELIQQALIVLEEKFEGYGIKLIN